ncbi:hypothetical protein TIFTF001_008264 [Ficus carica]|uniref:Uncharacterized protein n=1 Tax=Ficus carica TaxID=3494 RepID=A0AA88A857_FICCA|nr:hypothetical protein TIFTF001_008264 [Ficus carica]
MADQSPSGTDLPQNQNEELDEAEPVFLQSQEEEDDDKESVPSEDDGVHTSVGELVSYGDEDDENKDQEIEDEDGDGDGEESCSSGEEGGSEGNEWSAAQIDGLFCPICSRPWTTGGDHYI